MPTAVAGAPTSEVAIRPRSPSRSVIRFVVGGVLATAHVALAPVWTWVPFTVVVTALATSVGLAPLLGIGILVLAAILLLARGIGALERARFAAVLGVDLPAPPARRPASGALAAGWAVLSDGSAWRAVLWSLVAPVLATVAATLTVAAWAAALTLISLPLWRGDVPTGSWLHAAHANGLLGVLAGVVLVPVSLAVASGCAAADTALARLLLSGGLTRQLTARVEQLTATRAGAADAADAERRRIERDLHDGAQQRLVALAVTLGRASAKFDDDPAAARELVRAAHGESKLALAELRDLARGIHPAVLTDRGLDAALSALASRCPVPVSLDVAVAGRCSPTVEATAYFVVAEALTNVAKHSGASSASVTVRQGGGSLLVEVTDDGRGGADAASGSGIAGLRRRVLGADGTVALVSPTGGPTRLTVEIPCA